MQRQAFFRHMAEKYGVEPDYPWRKYPDYAVFRHANRKWFCLLMNVPAAKLGLAGEACLQVVNLKARPDIIGSLRTMPGVLPAYHMNKEHWISVLLAGGLSDEAILDLVDESHALSR